jgi:transcriptional regulator with XRE-family HTH domain
MTPAEIRALRESRGETQVEFGAAVAKVLRRPAYHWTTVSRWENGAQDAGVPWHLVREALAPP